MYYHIYCNAKNIHSNYISAYEEFTKRLSPYCEITLHPDTTLTFPKDIQKKGHLLVLVQAGPSTWSSEEFAAQISHLQISGKSTVHVVIGHTDASFYEAFASLTDYDAPLLLSLTNSTLSCETKTLLFYEQLYRAYTILQGKTYHK